MNEQTFENFCKELNINLSEEQLMLLKKYAKFLLEYNQHTNLTAIKTVEGVYLKHFYDSLTITKVVSLQHGKLLDIGTGAGFPGLVLAIAFPKIQVDLLDSNHKKIDFLNQVIKNLKLNNVQTIYARCEDYAKKHKEEYDYITSRAVAELRILLEISIPCLKIGASFLAMKSSTEEELTIANDTIYMLNSSIKNKIEFHLPYDAGKRTIIEIKKEKKTPEIYPRPYNLILKKPLKKKIN